MYYTVRAKDLDLSCARSTMEQITKILAVGLGGALGAVARYLINISPLKDLFGRFPFPTFLINITGSFLIGLLVVLFTDKYGVAENTRLALLVGFLGAYTTFSTFEFETWTLIRDGNYVTALMYVVLSVLTGFAALIAGVALAQRI